MADTKMSALPARTVLTGTDEFLNLAGGANYRSPLSSLTSLLVSLGILDSNAIDNTAYDATAWNGVTTKAPSQDALRDKIVSMDAAIAAAGGAVIEDTAYGAGWNGVTTLGASKNALYDIISTLAPLASPALSGVPTAPTAAPGTNTTQLATTEFVTAAAGGGVSDTAYDATSWDGVTTTAPSKNAVRDKFVANDATIAALQTVSAPITLLTNRATDGTPGGVDWEGGPGLLSVYGTWGTATVQIAYSPDGGTTYIDTEGALLSAANSTMLLTYPAGKVRATVATAGGGTSLNAKLESTV